MKKKLKKLKLKTAMKSHVTSIGDIIANKQQQLRNERNTRGEKKATTIQQNKFIGIYLHIIMLANNITIYTIHRNHVRRNTEEEKFKVQQQSFCFVFLGFS